MQQMRDVFQCFLSALLGKEQIVPTSIETTATVTLGTVDGGPQITGIELKLRSKYSRTK